MSKYLKTYEEWNPFLSKEEKARRAEEAKRKEEEEVARRKEEEKLSKEEESLKELRKAAEEIQSYKNSSILSLEKSKYNNDPKFFLFYIKLNDKLLKDLKIKASYVCSLSLSNSWLGNYINLKLELKVNKSDIDIPSDIIEKVNDILYRNDIRLSSYGDTYEFRIDIQKKNELSNIKNFLDNCFNWWSINSLKSRIEIINKTFELIEREKEKRKKQEEFKEKANEILDCFCDVIDLCESYESSYIEDKNCYRFIFKINSVKISPYDIKYIKPYGKSYGGSGHVSVEKSSFFLDDNMLNFFFYLSEAKPRITDLVPNCKFKVDIVNGSIILEIS